MLGASFTRFSAARETWWKNSPALTDPADMPIDSPVGDRNPRAAARSDIVQAPGLIANRWLFFAQAKHPQNLYYQVVS